MASAASGAAAPNSFLFPGFTQANVRNYSDMMRSLAAKYNGTEEAAPPPPPTRRGSFTPPRRNEVNSYGSNGAATSQQKERSGFVEPTTSANPLAMLGNLQFTTGIMPSIVDMSSTQLLITLVSLS